jgi:hypothetical protein
VFPTFNNKKYCSSECAKEGYKLKNNQSELRRKKWKMYNQNNSLGKPYLKFELDKIEEKYNWKREGKNE